MGLRSVSRRSPSQIQGSGITAAAFAFPGAGQFPWFFGLSAFLKFRGCNSSCLVLYLGSFTKAWFLGQAVKTSPSHGENRSSILLGTTPVITAMAGFIYEWNRSSAGMSVRLTRGRSWVRAPSVPSGKSHSGEWLFSFVHYFADIVVDSHCTNIGKYDTVKHDMRMNRSV